MNVEYINPFIEASTGIINQTTGMEPTLGKTYVKTVIENQNGIVVYIGLSGMINGSVCIELSVNTACRIASAMMGGFPVESLDEMATSAVAELGNMILGNASILLSNRNINVDITPPKLFIQNKVEFSENIKKIICVPLVFDGESSILLNLAVS